MLTAVVCAVILLVTADTWVQLLKGTTPGFFWSIVALVSAAFLVASYLNPYMLAVPALLAGGSLLLAFLQYRFLDRPRLVRSSGGESSLSATEQAPANESP